MDNGRQATTMTIHFIAKWYDMWIGMYWDGNKKRLYILPIPCLGFYLEFKNANSSQR